MFKSYTLSPYHYASKWDLPKDAEQNDREEVNKLAIRYSSLPESIEKEDLFLQLVRSFHSYLMKYTVMVVKGQLPSIKTPSGKEAAKMLKTLMPSGSGDNYGTLTQVCKTLHLAFKQQTTDDVYDVMVICFLKAIKKYDPFYHLKIKQVSEYLNEKFLTKGSIDVNSVTEDVGYPASHCLKWLARKGFLEAILSEKKITAYRRGEVWPIPDKTFSTEPIGFTYFVHMWFRYYLNDYITNSMSELEAKPDILQLEHAYTSEGLESFGNGNKEMVPCLNGNFTDANGLTWSADLNLMNLQLDVSPINSDWVYSNEDKLFKDLTTKQRWLFKMIYLDELTWVEIADNLDCTVNTAKSQWKNAIQIIRNKIDL
ncbi:MAG: RNA polymerase sigma factor [Janthinobacterium lividum]